MPLTVDLVSPEEILYSGEGSMVVARTSDGDIAFQPGHVPFVGTLVPCVAKVIFPGGGEQRIAVHSGFIEVAHDHVTILSDAAELAERIDVDRARAARDRARETASSDPEAAAALARAEARLRAVGTD
ncbi:MAG: ATP synthase F1 subunit epsilon [Acidimicrobiales bacterium]|nr:ATP synthase F1 subunit epsilon [Acidimicrobiales bacterium]